MRTICLYHKNCFDGICSAWVVYKYLKRLEEGSDSFKFPEVIFHPMNYGEDYPWDIPRDSQIIMVDFSFKAKVLQELAMRVKSILIIDHHKTAQAELQDFRMENVKIHFDMDESGASLAWKTFFPSEEVPLLVRYIRDRDLWRFKESDSEIINSWIQSYPMLIEHYADMHFMLETEEGFKIAHAGGISILRYKQTMVESICKNAAFDGLGIPTVNTSILFSEVGHRLCELYPNAPYSRYYFDRLRDNTRQFGLRSIGEFDVSEIAKVNGGGGHKNAAGYQHSLSEI